MRGYVSVWTKKRTRNFIHDGTTFATDRVPVRLDSRLRAVLTWRLGITLEDVSFVNGSSCQPRLLYSFAKDLASPARSDLFHCKHGRLFDVVHGRTLPSTDKARSSARINLENNLLIT